ncbi:bifunctional 5,10-methylenetetrahydrofolate dehydrogenase/5,10-methenyltetrahydrofolate cyclohydrolase [Candidatus Nomurabacteria bacterium]|nr:bifunctional 5,10-methylenetetrahydrofolate dehydrogenase/5,10-methenyltetrahydrofolate cyclohydrolase [Candidatus Nomurabacteria bacterium]
MNTQVFNGKEQMQQLRNHLRDDFSVFSDQPILHIIIVGFHPVIERFVRMKKRFGEYIGVGVEIHRLDVSSTTQDCQSYIRDLVEHTSGPAGCIVQLPLPQHIDVQSVLDTVPPAWDVDVLGKEAYEIFESNTGTMIPPVARAIGFALEHTPQNFATDCLYVVVGNGKLVGKPTMTLLAHHGISPIVLDKDSPSEIFIQSLTTADIIISGVGKPHMITPDMISEGVVLIDAGTSEGEGVLRGDIDPACYAQASWYTPVPGGIGPLTVAMIFVNLYESYKHLL